MPASRSKLTPGLMRTLAQVQDRRREVSIIVRYRPYWRVVRTRLAMPGIRHGYHYHLWPFAHMYVTVDALVRIELDPAVVVIYQDLPVTAYLDTSMSRIQVPRLWSEGLTGKGMRIAIIDSGVDAEHPDLKGRVAAVQDFTGEGPNDRHGHGTHCASIAAGSGAASGGEYRGAAPEASIYSAKVLGSDGLGMMSDVMAGIEWAHDQGVHVVSLSLGSSGSDDSTDALGETCDAVVDEGIVVCVAAGNEGPNPGTICTPGSARKVITVGAATEEDQVATFSSRGPTADGRPKPDVVLPGVGIIGARARGTGMGTIVNQYYSSASGSSMATPHAAGVCALLLQAEPDLTPHQVKERLMSTAIDLGADRNAQGTGRVDAWRALRSKGEAPQPTEPAPGPGPALGQGCLPALLKVLFWGR